MKGHPFSVVVWSCLKTLNPQRRKRPMGHKYVGLDVHQSSTVAAVHDEQGKSVMESILGTEAEAIGDKSHWLCPGRAGSGRLGVRPDPGWRSNSPTVLAD